jgi:hypothetical protein
VLERRRPEMSPSSPKNCPAPSDTHFASFSGRCTSTLTSPETTMKNELV